MMTKMTSNKPYFIRALYDWIVDNELTPYLLVSADYPGVEVPQEYVNHGKIILDISPLACRGLHLENDRIVFSARFSGRTIQIFLPPAAVLAIYAQENGRGMEFDIDADESVSGVSTEETLTAVKTKSRAKPTLTLVKSEKVDKFE